MQIVDIQLDRVQKRLAEQGYQLKIGDDLRAYLAERGYEPTYGARPLKRTIQRLLQDPLALRILSGDFAPGDTIVVGRADDELTFEKA